jgi:hypothetical protein
MVLIIVLLLAVCPAVGQVAEIAYTARLEHPRLLLPAKRLRLLQRERERETLRWTQFNLLVAGKAKFPEPGFAFALYYQTSLNKDFGRAAVTWALGGGGTDLRQLALVFDWCQAVLSADEKQRLVRKIEAALEKTAGAGELRSLRNRVMGALALAGHVEGIERKYLQPVIEDWWKKNVLDRLNAGETPVRPKDHYALIEMMHAIRDNLDVDLRESAAKHFTTMPAFHILSHYPAPYPAAENEYRIPLMAAHGEPDPRDAVESRAAALSMVAFDTNSQDTQFLQGWLIHDRFLMRSTYGIPYEFLWANPYQPGLSYHYLPNIFHDPKTGRLILRSSWEDDAVWYYQAQGNLQMFRNGEIVNIEGGLKEAVAMGNTILLPKALTGKFQVEAEEPVRYYLVGMEPLGRFEIETDDEEMRELESDRGGVLEIVLPARRKAAVRVRYAGPVKGK